MRSRRTRRSRFGGLFVAAALAAGIPAAGAQAATLKAPSLQAPSAAASVQTPPTFSWKVLPGADRYDFQLSDDVKFGSIVLGRGAGRGAQRTRNTAATLAKTIPDGTYFWRVRGITKAGKAGRWTGTRTLKKRWTDAASITAPTDGTKVQWPSTSLVLRWSPVPHATHYLVTVATDPSLAQSVLGTSNQPVQTQGTVFALRSTLPAGTYYWAVTPVDAGGQQGTRSRVATFDWAWNTATATSFTDLNATAAVIDPLLEWNAVPGAARYEVEINPDDDFSAGSRVCCKERVVGTSLSPLRLLPNNNDFSGSSGYHWRVRAFDADDNPGQWNVGTPFEKSYDNVTPSVPGVSVETVTSADAATASPLVTWGAVPGAAQYQVQWTAYVGGSCGWSNASAPIKTSSLAWAPLAPVDPPAYPRPTGVPGGIGITASMDPNGTSMRAGQPFNPERAYSFPSFQSFTNGTTYCVRVRALSDDSYRENDNATSQVISQWTQAGSGAENEPAFTYGGPPTTADPAPSQLPAPEYLSPVGLSVDRTPVLRWKPVAGARRYFVLISRDSNFTNVIDAAYTAMPAYVPNLALEDEDTTYFWAVVPASQSDGSGISGGPKSYSPQQFNKLSVPPTPAAPAQGAVVSTQPTFRWAAVDGAQKYRVQVSTDPQFGSLLDDVVTAATAYTSQTPYPVDTVLYWRARAEQSQVLQGAERVELRWSSTASFRRSLPVPALSAENALQGELIPVFAWAPVPGAISYELHVDEPDGDRSDFTVQSPVFAPTKYTGTGTVRYKVRANFATRSGSVASAYSGQGSFTRIISPPPGPRTTRTTTRLLFGWGAAAAAARYQVEVSATDSFTKIIDSVKTDNANWAPDLTKRGFAGNGALYWRVATIDEDNNVGGFVTNRIPAGKALRLKLRGALRRGKRSTIRVTVTDAGGKLLPATKVSVKGAGVKAISRRTTKRGTTTLTLRPSRTGTVTFTASRAGYPSKVVTMKAGR